MDQVIYDVGVVGLGAMGSATLWNLQKLMPGLQTIGWERFDIPHTFGSSHGHSRIIRLAYFEGDAYVPLAKRSFELWRELEKSHDQQLLHVTGGLDIGESDSILFQGSLESCQIHKLPHEVLSGEEVNRRFPGFNVPGHFKAVFQPDAGFLDPEACISAMISQSLASGATVRAREQVVNWSWDERSKLFQVTTSKSKYKARKLVLSAGAWASNIAQGFLPTTIEIERQVFGWFSPKQGKEEMYETGKFPIFILEDGGREYYGFPMYKIPGVKYGLFGHFHELVNPETYAHAKQPREDDERVLRESLERYCPNACGTTLSLHPCMFSNSEDRHFIIDKVPTHPNAVIAAGFSGHGFKFAPVIGELILDLLFDEREKTELSKSACAMFSIKRFTPEGAHLLKPAKVISKSKL